MTIVKSKFYIVEKVERGTYKVRLDIGIFDTLAAAYDATRNTSGVLVWKGKNMISLRDEYNVKFFSQSVKKSRSANNHYCPAGLTMNSILTQS